MSDEKKEGKGDYKEKENDDQNIMIDVFNKMKGLLNLPTEIMAEETFHVLIKQMTIQYGNKITNICELLKEDFFEGKLEDSTIPGINFAIILHRTFHWQTTELEEILVKSGQGSTTQQFTHRLLMAYLCMNLHLRST